MADSEVVQTMRGFKQDLLASEQKQMEQMATRWLGVEKRLQSQMDALALEMTAVQQAGGTVTQATLMNNTRYRALMGQLMGELNTYTDYAERTISRQQSINARDGIQHASEAIDQQIIGTFNKLPIESTQYMVGLAGDGSPLRSILVESWPVGAQRLTQELIDGVALGYNPRKTASNMAEGLTGTLNRMMVIARTEQLRVYRESSMAAYKQSGIVSGIRRLTAHDNRVCSACLADEGTFYPLTEELPEHPQGRCIGIPVVAGTEPIDWLKGEDWLIQQTTDTQEDILGPKRYELWRTGKMALTDTIKVEPDVTWGPSMQVKPLREVFN